MALGPAASAPPTHTLGVPRIGTRRELKRALESAWRGDSTMSELQEVARALRADGWRRQREAGVDLVACNDFSLYDHVLDTILPGGVSAAAVRFSRGAHLHRHHVRDGPGRAPRGAGAGDDQVVRHQLPPPGPRALAPDAPFGWPATSPSSSWPRRGRPGCAAKPVLVGPRHLPPPGQAGRRGARGVRSAVAARGRCCRSTPRCCARLDRLGAEWVQLDEPVLALDLPVEVRAAFARAYERLRAAAPRLRLMVATYFGPLGANLETFLQLPVAGLHVDAVRGRAELPALLERFPRGRTLSLGVVDGRNIWRTDLADAWSQLELRPRRAWGRRSSWSRPPAR